MGTIEFTHGIAIASPFLSSIYSYPGIEPTFLTRVRYHGAEAEQAVFQFVVADVFELLWLGRNDGCADGLQARLDQLPEPCPGDLPHLAPPVEVVGVRGLFALRAALAFRTVDLRRAADPCQEAVCLNPALRADVFVQRWQGLERQRRLLLRDHEETRANRIADRMMGMAKGLERDPQVESILRNRKVQLGLGNSTDPGVGRELEQMIGRTRSRGLGIGM